MEQEISKGIKFEASFRQIFAAMLVVVVMFVVPVFTYESLAPNHPKSTEVYTTESLEGRTEGRVAGISTKKSDQKSSVVEQLEILSSSGVLLIIGITLLVVSLILASALVYDFYKAS